MTHICTLAAELPAQHFSMHVDRSYQIDTHRGITHLLGQPYITTRPTATTAASLTGVSATSTTSSSATPAPAPPQRPPSLRISSKSLRDRAKRMAAEQRNLDAQRGKRGTRAKRRGHATESVRSGVQATTSAPFKLSIHTARHHTLQRDHGPFGFDETDFMTTAPDNDKDDLSMRSSESSTSTSVGSASQGDVPHADLLHTHARLH